MTPNTPLSDDQGEGLGVSAPAEAPLALRPLFSSGIKVSEVV
jgi:hypothetical protein